MKISVAYINKPRGFKGELAVIPYKPGTETLRDGLNVTLMKGDLTGDFLIKSVSFLKGRMALKLQGIESAEDALYWLGGEVLVEQDDLSSLNPNEYYHFQIEGAQVFEENGRLVGTVDSIDFLAANDVLNVKTENGDVQIPFIKSIIVSVDILNKKIVIRKIEGLY
jgi:16S rRNA processing protein RimM